MVEERISNHYASHRMFLRAYQVLSKPSDDLITLLGIEVPAAPALSLHGIRADGVILNWKAPDLQKTSTIKYCLFVNGISGMSDHQKLFFCLEDLS
jgi:hypothetical protein